MGKGPKLISKDKCLIHSHLAFLAAIFNSMKSKVYKFELRITQLSKAYFSQYLRSLHYFYLLWIIPWIKPPNMLVLHQKNLDSIDSINFN